jgi:hypothetical protein
VAGRYFSRGQKGHFIRVFACLLSVLVIGPLGGLASSCRSALAQCEIQRMTGVGFFSVFHQEGRGDAAKSHPPPPMCLRPTQVAKQEANGVGTCHGPPSGAPAAETSEAQAGLAQEGPPTVGPRRPKARKNLRRRAGLCGCRPLWVAAAPGPRTERPFGDETLWRWSAMAYPNSL